MRLLLVSTVAAVLLAPAAGYAQSAYDYPWCAVYSGRFGPGGAMSCYYASYGQCMQTLSGIGGSCIRSPYYGHGPSQRGRRDKRDY